MRARLPETAGGGRSRGTLAAGRQAGSLLAPRSLLRRSPSTFARRALAGHGRRGPRPARPGPSRGPLSRAHRGASTSLCSRQAIMISDRMTTPVRPTPALQWTSNGGLGLLGSLVLFVWRRTDWISSRYAVKHGGHRLRGTEAQQARSSPPLGRRRRRGAPGAGAGPATGRRSASASPRLCLRSRETQNSSGTGTACC